MVPPPPPPPPPPPLEGCEYENNECEPNDACLERIQPLIEFMLSHPDTCITIFAHTDSVGTDEYNLELSQCRADAIERILIEAGIDDDRISPIGMGECCPIADNGTPEGRQRNRRFEFQFWDCRVR